MAENRLLERLTASDLFLLLWDDYGWSTDIGGLAILDGTSLLDRDSGRDCTWFPVSGSCCADPGLGWAGPCGSTPPPSTSQTTSESTHSPLPATKPSCLPHARNWRGDGWIRPGRCGSYGCCPACPGGGWAPS
jgi:hypothetical protein